MGDGKRRGRCVVGVIVISTCLSSVFSIAGRPAFTARDRLSAENFFITALDKWREKMGLEKVILMGHSMGGYLAATYALQHPERVQHLVLVCPAGVVSFCHSSSLVRVANETSRGELLDDQSCQ